MSALTAHGDDNRAKSSHNPAPPDLNQPTTKITWDMWEFEPDDWRRKNPHLNLPAGNLIGECRITGLISQSSVGITLKGQQLSLEGRPVAIKLLHPDLTGDRRMRLWFKEEATIVARLHHSAFPTVYTADLDCACPFYAMEFTHGIDLVQRVREGGPLPLHRAMLVVRQVAQALQYARKLGVVHRGFHPASVLLIESPFEPDWSVKLLDCGASEADPYDQHCLRDLRDSSHGDSSRSIGPRTADVRADVDSLKMTLRFLLTGKFAKPCGATMNAESRLRADTEAEIPPAVRDLIRCRQIPTSGNRSQTLADFLEQLDHTRPAGHTESRQPE